MQTVVNFAFIAYQDDTDTLGGLILALWMYEVIVYQPLIGLNSFLAVKVPLYIELERWRHIGRILNAGRLVNTLISLPLMAILIVGY